MKVVSSQLRLQSTHQQRIRHSQHRRLQLWQNDRALSQDALRAQLRGSRALGSPSQALGRSRGEDSLQIRRGGEQQEIEPKGLRSKLRPAIEVIGGQRCDQGEAIPSITGDAEMDGELLVFAFVIARLTGRPVYLSRLGAQLSGQMKEAADRCASLQRLCAPLENESSAVPPVRPEQEPLRFRYEEENEWSEYEQLELSVAGEVCTADGRRINLELELNFERSYLSKELHVIENQPLKDPLIFDLGATAAQFTERRLSFDIDADGHLDLLPTLDESGAFLTLDKNGDGEINDGGELIGAISGDAFGELRALDDDQSGWLDEGDEVFERLTLWGWDADGQARLMGLAEVGVGAIYLGAIDAAFEHRGSAQEKIAQQRAASLYLKNTGNVGSIRQVDVAG